MRDASSTNSSLAITNDQLENRRIISDNVSAKIQREKGELKRKYAAGMDGKAKLMAELNGVSQDLESLRIDYEKWHEVSDKLTDQNNKLFGAIKTNATKLSNAQPAAKKDPRDAHRQEQPAPGHHR